MREERPVGLDLAESYMTNCAGPEPWSTGGIWISRGKTFAKILRSQRMLHVPGGRERVTVPAEAGDLVTVLGI